MQGTIVEVKAGHKLPDEVIKLLVAKSPGKYFAFAVLDGGKLEHMLMDCVRPDKDGKVAKFEGSLRAVNDEYEKVNLLLWLAEEDITADENQPFVLVESKDGPVLLAFVEGEFENYASEDADMNAGATFIMEFLADECLKVYNDCGKNSEKMLQALEGPAFRKRLYDEGHMKPRGVLTMIGLDGVARHYSDGNGDTATKNYSFGWISKDIGYKEAKPEPEKSKLLTPDEVRALPIKEKLAYKKAHPDWENPKPVAEPVPKSITSVPQVTPKVETKTTFPPPEAKGKDLKKWYDKHHINKAHGVNLMDNNGRGPGITAATVQKSSHHWASLTAPAKKDTDAHSIAERTNSAVKSGDAIPILSAEDVAKVVAIAKDAPVTSVEDLKAGLVKYPPFSIRTTVPLETYAFWSRDTINQLGPDAKTDMIMELKLRIIQDNPGLAKKEEPKEKLLTPEEVAALPIKEKLAYKKAHPDWNKAAA